MTRQFSMSIGCMWRLVAMSIVVTIFAILQDDPAYGIPQSALFGDYNDNGIVSHGDYSVLGDTFGSVTDLRADGNQNGIVDPADFDVYRTHYGELLSLPAILPLTVRKAQTPGGNVEWIFVFSNVNGALAGHLNITTGGPSVLSMTGGLGFLDDRISPVGVPGKRTDGSIVSGLTSLGNQAFAALGTTLANPTALLGSNSTLEFLRLVTAGNQPTTLTYSGEFGYQGVDYIHSGTASFLPEPASAMLVVAGIILCSVTMRRRSSCARARKNTAQRGPG